MSTQNMLERRGTTDNYNCLNTRREMRDLELWKALPMMGFPSDVALLGQVIA